MPFNSMVAADGRLFGASQDGIFELSHGVDDNGVAVASNVLWDLDDLGSPQKKRTVSAYINGESNGPFTVRVINTQGRFSYKTTATSRDAGNHRAPLGRGLESTYFRFGLYQNKDYSVDRVNVELDSVKRRI